MEYRVFQNRGRKTNDDDRPKTFGRRAVYTPTPAEDEVSAAQLLKALALGLGIGALAAFFAPAL
ncbi:hypothetical protein [Chenggangzhangella methanolivorans]|uniref:Uncharacterized protein n=1 Tax=Chenggangzhangella methanolivorans TaxID=1437009 RepID=A0A9E6RGK7_9HYPH|nr:hypothetical protein [Chenggangzhangella methanolivorans]QZO01056.1 hypothetical protein K6K41_05570 [Chenggangzhangella methanolivorans]